MINNAELDAAAASIKDNRAAEARSKYQPFNETVRDALLAYLEKHGISRGDLARELGFGTTQVIKYLNGKPDWNVTKFEHAADGVLRTAEKRALFKAELFPTSVTRQINAVCETIRKTDDFGLIHSAAGWGKSSGLKLYGVEYASAVSLAAHLWARSASDQLRMLWEAAGSGTGTTSPRFGETRMSWLRQKFDGSHRPVLIDNAHRLTRGALQFWFDFHDATGVPIIFFGNPEVMEIIEKNDQMFSRLGLIEMVELDQREYEKVARQLILQVLHEQVEELEDLAQETIGRKGHLRTLRKQLTLAREIREGNRNVDWRNAFKAAGMKLVRQEKDQPPGKPARR